MIRVEVDIDLIEQMFQTGYEQRAVIVTDGVPEGSRLVGVARFGDRLYVDFQPPNEPPRPVVWKYLTIRSIG